MREFIMLNVFICTVVSDLQNYKIRNSAILAGWAAGICINILQRGVYGAANTIFCIMVTIITGFPLFMTGGIGAGVSNRWYVWTCFPWKSDVVVSGYGRCSFFRRVNKKKGINNEGKGFYLLSSAYKDCTRKILPEGT